MYILVYRVFRNNIFSNSKNYLLAQLSFDPIESLQFWISCPTFSASLPFPSSNASGVFRPLTKSFLARPWTIDLTRSSSQICQKNLKTIYWNIYYEFKISLYYTDYIKNWINIDYIPWKIKASRLQYKYHNNELIISVMPTIIRLGVTASKIQVISFFVALHLPGFNRLLCVSSMNPTIRVYQFWVNFFVSFNALNGIANILYKIDTWSIIQNVNR